MATTESTAATPAIRPVISTEQARRIFADFYNQPDVITIKELDSYSDRNFYFEVSSGNKFVLKIMSEKDSNIPYMTAISDMLLHLASKKFTFQIPQLITSKLGKYIEMVPLLADGEAKHCAILLAYIPGVQLREFYKGKEFDSKKIYGIGQRLGGFIRAYNEFNSPGLDFRKEYLWDTANLHVVEQYFPKIQDFVAKKDLDLLRKYFDLFMKEIKPIIHGFLPSCIHSDLNEMNLLVNDTGELSGVIDYTDMVYSYRIFDIGNCLAYMMMHFLSEECDPFQISRYIIQGMITELELTQLERDNLLSAVTSRLVLSIVLGYYYYSLEPTNEYLLTTPKPAFNLLQHISTYAKSDVDKIWFQPVEL